ncbi:hypothetical protein M9H77_02146 [Catharanthus roseus]|uniref:Uncharacterized protein n=1 Tax=Catharanthus roseus TaxID=4058 RepID=A0ACC0C7Q2_CATRO|nr:hypothetical protein M9H77_02146 [Catharanthus roseus]
MYEIKTTKEGMRRLSNHGAHTHEGYNFGAYGRNDCDERWRYLRSMNAFYGNGSDGNKSMVGRRLMYRGDIVYRDMDRKNGDGGLVSKLDGYGGVRDYNFNVGNEASFVPGIEDQGKIFEKELHIIHRDITISFSLNPFSLYHEVSLRELEMTEGKPIENNDCVLTFFATFMKDLDGFILSNQPFSPLSDQIEFLSVKHVLSFFKVFMKDFIGFATPNQLTSFLSEQIEFPLDEHEQSNMVKSLKTLFENAQEEYFQVLEFNALLQIFFKVKSFFYPLPFKGLGVGTHFEKSTRMFPRDVILKFLTQPFERTLLQNLFFLALTSTQNLSFPFHRPFKQILEDTIDSPESQDSYGFHCVLFGRSLVKKSCYMHHSFLDNLFLNFYAYTSFKFHKPFKES